jgi:hypothetical protein
LLAPPAGCTVFTILAYLPHHRQFCSAPQPMTTGHQCQLYSSSHANDTSSSAPDLPFWRPICLMAPHVPFWRPTAFWRPTCLMAPHMPYGAPSALWPLPHLLFWCPSAFLVPTSALWHPICLFGTPLHFWCPHLPYGTPSALWHPICLFGAPLSFWHPHPPFGTPFTFCKPHLLFGSPTFLKRPMTKCLTAKRGPGFQFPGCYSWITSSSCAMTNQLYQLLLQFLQHLSHVSGCASIQVIIFFGHIRGISLLDLPREICFGNVPREPNIWLGKHTQKLCPLACLV